MSRFSFSFDTETSKEPEPDKFGHALGLFIQQWQKEIGADRLRLADHLEWYANWERNCYAEERMEDIDERLGRG
jgi:hypothetical protein